jgi:Photosynthetic reaction centre cytochrome C subunit
MKKAFVAVGIIAFVVLGIAASKPPKGNFKNLKVLPRDISREDLDKVMDEFKDALGVRCSFCHVRSKENPQEWDHASDAKPEKEVARKMMRMTKKINSKYFHFNKSVDADAVQAVSCKTCHRGSPHPDVLN